MRIDVVTERDLPDLLPLMRGYCDFYRSSPSDDALVAMSRALIADPDCEGLQLIARDSDDGGRAIGVATIFWTGSTNAAARRGVMNDLIIAPRARGGGGVAGLLEAWPRRGPRRGGGAARATTRP